MCSEMCIRDRPKARFNSSFAKQNLILVDGYAADDHLRVFIVHRTAPATDITLSVVPVGDFLF